MAAEYNLEGYFDAWDSGHLGMCRLCKRQIRYLTWFGGPANMPADIVSKINDAVVESLKTPEIRKQISDLGADVVGLGPDGFNKVILTELEKFERLARAANWPKE